MAAFFCSGCVDAGCCPVYEFHATQSTHVICILMPSYSGIGSRQAPSNILDLMSRVAVRLARRGYVLRSGAADGSDRAFEAGAREVGGGCEVFLPWRAFNGSASPLFNLPLDEQASLIASQSHPTWGGLKPPVRKLHTRNAYQVLGRDLNDPVEFVACWTPDGAETAEETSPDTGGTGTAIRVADLFRVPVINFARPNALDRIAAIVTAPAQANRTVLVPPRLHLDGSIPDVTAEEIVWVYGSNLAGRHGAGAAKVAANQFGAKRGVGTGLMGHSYAIATKDERLKVLQLDEISPQIDEFIKFAHLHPELQFFVTRVGCDLAGYADKTIAPLFSNAPGNCSFAAPWLPYLLKTQSNAPTPIKARKFR